MPTEFDALSDSSSVGRSVGQSVSQSVSPSKEAKCLLIPKRNENLYRSDMGMQHACLEAGRQLLSDTSVPSDVLVGQDSHSR